MSLPKTMMRRRFERRASGLPWLSSFLAWALLTVAGCQTPAARDLPLGRPFLLDYGRPPAPRSSSQDETKRFRLQLRQGSLLRVVARQQGVDVALHLTGPGLQPGLDVDHMNGLHGVEPLIYLAVASGDHELEVRRRGAGNGTVTLEATLETEPSPAAREAARACRLVSAADADGEAPDRPTRCGHLERYAEAVDGWRVAHESEAELLTEIRYGSRTAECDDLGTAERRLERALRLQSTAGLAGGEPALFNALGKVYERTGKGTRARETFEKALVTARRQGERNEEGAALNLLANQAEKAGELWETLVYLDQAQEVFRSIRDPHAVATVLYNRARIFVQVGRLADAKAAFEQALSTYRAEHRPDAEARALLELGWLQFREGDVETAEGTIRRALESQKEIRDEHQQATILDRLGSVLREDGRPREAIPLYRQAIAISRDMHDLENEATSRSNLGGALVLAGDAEAALREENDALRLFGGRGAPSFDAFSLWRRSAALQRLGRLAEARTDIELSIVRLESLRSGAASDDLRRDYLDSVHEIYEQQVDILMSSHAAEPAKGWDAAALEAAERSRARTLLELVSKTRTNSPGGTGSTYDHLSQVEHQIRELEIQAGLSSVASGPGPLDPGVGDAAPLRALLEERERLRVELRRARGAPEPVPHQVTIGEIQRSLLDGDTTLLVYSLGEQRSFVWALTADRLASAELPKRSRLEELARRFHDLAARGVTEAELSQQALTAKVLSDTLLLPIAPLLQDRRIAVVADGALAYVPFELLPAPQPETGLIVDHHEVVTLPSASVLDALRRRSRSRHAAPHRLAVLADPLFAPPGSNPKSAAALSTSLNPTLVSTLRDLSRSSRDLGLDRLPSLPYSRQEADSILPLTRVGDRLVALGSDASLPLALSGRLASYRTIVFATHALIHPVHPELSGLVLSLFDASGKPQRGFLRSYEILDLQLPAELVVLSACRTGLGQELRGEGLVGLTQSFFHAGASRLLVSLWSVDDEATSVLMASFYDGILRRHLSPSAALRSAQLELRRHRRWVAPLFWAGFQLQGDWRTFD